MGIRLPDAWVWDSWFAVDGDTVHAFFLHAPRSLGDPRRRHLFARVGHATSRDLIGWEAAPFSLEAGPPGAWDELATWTGSVIRDGDGWLMAYTGLSVSEGTNAQRIGFCRSGDLMTWSRVGPVIEPDPRWYESPRDFVDAQWRDPWLWRDDDGTLHLYITARMNIGPDDGRGVVGHAWSVDGDQWEIGPPVSQPGELWQLEVPQLVEAAPARWVVLASAHDTDHSAGRRARSGFVAETGTVALEAGSSLGPFVVPPGPFLDGTPEGRRYAGRIVEHRGQRWFLAWLDRGPDGSFVGELADPILIIAGEDGRLRLMEA